MLSQRQRLEAQFQVHSFLEAIEGLPEDEKVSCIIFKKNQLPLSNRNDLILRIIAQAPADVQLLFAEAFYNKSNFYWQLTGEYVLEALHEENRLAFALRFVDCIEGDNSHNVKLIPLKDRLTYLQAYKLTSVNHDFYKSLNLIPQENRYHFVSLWKEKIQSHIDIYYTAKILTAEERKVFLQEIKEKINNIYALHYAAASLENIEDRFAFITDLLEERFSNVPEYTLSNSEKYNQFKNNWVSSAAWSTLLSKLSSEKCLQLTKKYWPQIFSFHWGSCYQQHFLKTFATHLASNDCLDFINENLSKINSAAFFIAALNSLPIDLRYNFALEQSALIISLTKNASDLFLILMELPKNKRYDFLQDNFLLLRNYGGISSSIKTSLTASEVEKLELFYLRNMQNKASLHQSVSSFFSKRQDFLKNVPEDNTEKTNVSIPQIQNHQILRL